MNERSSKLSVGIAVLFEIILIVTAIMSIATREWRYLFLTLLAMLCLMLPFIVTRMSNKQNITLPSSFQSVMLVLIFLAQYLGEIKKFYIIIWWWDLLLHAIFGGFAVIIALYLLKGTIRKGQKTSKQRFAFLTIILAFSFSIALSTLWEMFEFVGDYLFKANMVKGGLEDTSTDLLMTIVAAFITSVICYFRRLSTRRL